MDHQVAEMIRLGALFPVVPWKFMEELKVLVLLLMVTHLLTQAGRCANLAARKPELAALLRCSLLWC